MKKTVIVMLMLIVVAVACTEKPIPVEPDGGIGDTPIPVEPDGGIGDTPDNFELTDPYIRYVSTDTEECKAILFQCIPGSSAFNDDTGCGCRADEPKNYISTDPQECSSIRYMCEEGRMPFSDETGCGCEFTFEVQDSQDLK